MHFLCRRPHFFEFMDLPWLPASLRQVLRDILDCGNGRPFRGYYDWVVSETLRVAAEHGLVTVVELGAGTAPITRRLAADFRSTGLSLVVCDLHPDLNLYDQLERQSPGRVVALRHPVDFSLPQKWAPKTLLVLSATLHHIPTEERPAVLAALAQSADAVLVFEPLRRTILSALFCLLSVIPALLTPLFQVNRPGWSRRIVWCWLVPVGPLLFVWDGLLSCWRQWTAEDWHRIAASHAGSFHLVQIMHTLFCQQVLLQREPK